MDSKEIVMFILKETNHVDISSSLNWFGDCLCALSEYESALPHYQEGIKKKLHSTEDEKTATGRILYFPLRRNVFVQKWQTCAF